MGKCRRKLKDGEYFNSSNNRYEYHYTDRLGKKRVITSARLEPNDPLPKSKRGGKSLREKEAEILKLLQNNIDVDGGKITVYETTLKFLEVLYAKKNITYNTKQSYSRICRTLNNTTLGHMAICDVKPEHCDEWFVTMKAKYRGSAMQTDLSLIKRTFEFAVDRDWIVKNPMKNLTVSRDDGTSRNPVSVEKMQSFLDFVKTEKHSHHCWELIHVLFWTGMRASEICGLTVDDLDFENRVIYVNKQVQKQDGVRVVTKVKSKNGIRVIPMTHEVEEALKAEIEKRHLIEEPVLYGEDGVTAYSGFVFLSTRRRMPMMRENVEEYMKNCIKRYNERYSDDPMPYCVPHVARHTFCTNLQQNGINPVTLQHIMGHGSIKTTLSWYTGVKAVPEQVAEMDGIVTKILTP